MKLTLVESLLSCFSLLAFSGTTLGQENGPDVVTVNEGDDVILPCSPSSKESITSKVFDWKKDGQKNRQEVFFYEAGIHYNNGRSGQDEQFKGRVSHFPGELKYGNASIKIRNTRIEDSGVYTCIFPHFEPRQTFHIRLLVVGAAPKPNVTILKQTENRALLQCEVRGAFPKPELHWKDSDGNILHAEEPKETEKGGRYDVILQTTVTKTDNYRCVATQEEISHQIYSETHVYFSEKQVEDKSNHRAGLFVGVAFAALLVAVVEAVIVGVMCKRGAARRPNVQTAYKIKELELLPREVSDVSPNPKSHLQNGNGHIPPDDHSFSQTNGRQEPLPPA